MNLVHVNCPKCQKLFMVRHEDLKPGFIKFNCTQCQNFFGFDWPQPPGTEHVTARLIEAPPSFKPPELPKMQATVNTAQNTSLVTCPRCQAQIKAELKECPQCGVMFDKVRKINTAPGMKVPKDMEEAWQEALKNYADTKKHEAFVQTCLKNNNLVFASHQYGAILKVTPQDEMAQKMQNRIVELASLAYLSNQAREKEPRRKLNIIGVIIGISALMVLVGIVVPTARTMVAVGCGLFAFVIGLRVFSKSV